MLLEMQSCWGCKAAGDGMLLGQAPLVPVWSLGCCTWRARCIGRTGQNRTGCFPAPRSDTHFLWLLLGAGHPGDQAGGDGSGH